MVRVCAAGALATMLISFGYMHNKFSSKAVLYLSVIVTSLATIVPLAPAPAQASTLVSELLPISQSGVACLTVDLCVVVGRDAKHGTGDVMVVNNGKLGKPSDVKGSQDLVAVTCPAGVGCIAWGQASGPTRPFIVETNDNGKVLGSGPTQVPAGVSFTNISCYSLANCRLFGTYRSRSSDVPEFGIWDGSSVLAEHLPLPPGVSEFTAAGVSCYIANCVAVGTGLKGGGHVGLVLDITGRSLTSSSVQPNAVMAGVSCVSPTLCYAVGNNGPVGFVVSLDSGMARLLSPVRSGHLAAIACQAALCLAVGSRQLKRGNRAEGTYGMLVGVSSGKVTSNTLVELSRGFTDVTAAPVGVGFAALGPAHGQDCEITTTN